MNSSMNYKYKYLIIYMVSHFLSTSGTLMKKYFKLLKAAAENWLTLFKILFHHITENTWKNVANVRRDINYYILSIIILTAENDQHDPHCFWSLTGVTAPSSLQSMFFGNSTFAGSINAAEIRGLSDLNWVSMDLLKPFNVFTNSWWSWKSNYIILNKYVHIIYII